jgi:hypothetical protein
MQSSLSPRSISPETFSQAAAGALLAAIGIAELSLAFAATGWWYRGGASLVAVLGAAVLIRSLAVIALPLRVDLVRRVARWQPAPRPAPSGRVVLAE